MRLEPVVVSPRGLPYLRVYYPEPRGRRFIHIGPLDLVPDEHRSEVQLVWRRLYRRSRTMTSRIAHFKVSIAMAALIDEFPGEVAIKLDCQDTGGMDPILGCLTRALKQRNMSLRMEHRKDLILDALILFRRLSEEYRTRHTALESYLLSQLI